MKLILMTIACLMFFFFTCCFKLAAHADRSMEHMEKEIDNIIDKENNDDFV